MIVVEITSKIMIEKELLIMFIEEMMKVKVLKILKVKNEEDHQKTTKKMKIHQKLIHMINIIVKIVIKLEIILKKHIIKGNVQKVKKVIHNMKQNIAKKEITTTNIKNLVKKDTMNQEEMIKVIIN